MQKTHLPVSVPVKLLEGAAQVQPSVRPFTTPQLPNGSLELAQRLPHTIAVIVTRCARTVQTVAPIFDSPLVGAIVGTIKGAANIVRACQGAEVPEVELGADASHQVVVLDIAACCSDIIYMIRSQMSQSIGLFRRLLVSVKTQVVYVQ